MSAASHTRETYVSFRVIIARIVEYCVRVPIASILLHWSLNCVGGIILSNSQFIEVARDLPKLVFDPERDSAWVAEKRVQAYLDYYSINLEREYPKLHHGFGKLEAEGFDIATHYWMPENPKGTLVVVHGYYDHVGLYGAALRFGIEQGLAVLAFDLPGHGLSSGERASIDSFDRYTDVLHQVLNAAAQLMPKPWSCLAQSTGGAVVLNYLWRHDPDRLDNIVLCAPLVLPRAWRLSKLIYWLAKPWVERVPRKFIDNSHDPEFNRFLSQDDGLQPKHLPVLWVGAMKAWDAKLLGYPRLNKPVLVVQGTGDRTVDWRYNLMRIGQKLPNSQIKMIEGAFHHLVGESEEYRRPVFEAVADWLEDSEKRYDAQ